jgi:hypothetical protein
VARCLGGSLVQLAKFTALAKDIQMGRMQTKAEVLLRLAREPLNFPRGCRLIVLDVSHLEEPLVNPRSIEALHPHFLR